jgi:hypothetical protein
MVFFWGKWYLRHGKLDSFAKYGIFWGKMGYNKWAKYDKIL